jgi:prepilin-type N-terminal cleavage/methylation domain-containing protein
VKYSRQNTRSGVSPGRLDRAAIPGSSRAGFTMIEIALCLAIIGFALVAIIGVLPSGMDVQKRNREETIINQDAQVLADAIRSGAKGYDDLTNYVISITNYVYRYDVTDTRTNLVASDLLSYGAANPEVYVFTRNQYLRNGTPPGGPSFLLTNGMHIVGLLTRPRYEWRGQNGQWGFYSNFIVANIHGISGSAIDNAPETNAVVVDGGFGYRLIVQNDDYVQFDPESTNYLVVPTNAPYEWISSRSNQWLYTQSLVPNAHEMRLTFRWPLLPNKAAGNERLTFRFLVGGTLFLTNDTPPNADPMVPFPLFFLDSERYLTRR